MNGVAHDADFSAVQTVRVEEYDASALVELKHRHAGERCFIIGNGPSLNRTEVALLSGEVTFGVNGIFFMTETCGFTPTYYVVEDNHVIENDLSRIRNVEAVHRFFPSRYIPVIESAPDVRFLRTDWQWYWTNSPFANTPRFSLDLADVIFAGQTVTYLNLQLAVYMGFKEIYLIGVDMDYAVPEDAPIEGNSITSIDADPNHFHPNYFGAGKRWHFPRLDRVQMNMEKAREIAEQNGIEIYNATRGGKLEAFDRVDYRDLFHHADDLPEPNGPLVTPVIAGLRFADIAGNLSRIIIGIGADKRLIEGVRREARRLELEVVHDGVASQADLVIADSEQLASGALTAVSNGARVLVAVDEADVVRTSLIDGVIHNRSVTWNRGLMEISPDGRFFTAPRFDIDRLEWLDSADEADELTHSAVTDRARPVWWDSSALTIETLRSLISELVTSRCSVTHQNGYIYAQSRWGSPREPAMSLTPTGYQS